MLLSSAGKDLLFPLGRYPQSPASSHYSVGHWSKMRGLMVYISVTSGDDGPGRLLGRYITVARVIGLQGDNSEWPKPASVVMRSCRVWHFHSHIHTRRCDVNHVWWHKLWYEATSAEGSFSPSFFFNLNCVFTPVLECREAVTVQLSEKIWEWKNKKKKAMTTLSYVIRHRATTICRAASLLIGPDCPTVKKSTEKMQGRIFKKVPLIIADSTKLSEVVWMQHTLLSNRSANAFHV